MISPSFSLPFGTQGSSLGSGHHHIDLPAATLRTHQPLAPIEHGRFGAVPSCHLGWVGLDPADLGSRGSAFNHRATLIWHNMGMPDERRLSVRQADRARADLVIQEEMTMTTRGRRELGRFPNWRALMGSVGAFLGKLSKLQRLAALVTIVGGIGALVNNVWSAHEGSTPVCTKQSVTIHGNVSRSTVTNEVIGDIAAAGSCRESTKK